MPDKAHSDSAKDPGLVKARLPPQLEQRPATTQHDIELPSDSLWCAAQDPARLTRAGVLTLQRMAGNQAVERVLRPPAAPRVQRVTLTVGAAHDAYEQEADRVAEQVLNMPAQPAAEACPPRRGLQRQEQEEEPVQALHVQRQEGEEEVQAKPVHDDPGSPRYVP